MHFIKANLVHNYSAQAASDGSLSYNKVNRVKYGIKLFRYQGVKVINDLKKCLYKINLPKIQYF